MTTPRVITALKLKKSEKNRITVFLDGEEAFTLHLAAAAGLRKGQALTGADIERLKKEDDLSRAYNQAIRYLASRSRSQKQTESHLTGKGYHREIVAQTINRLIKEKYLDDEAFARLWVENRERFRPRSNYALQYELKEKGIAPDTIDKVLSEFKEEESAWALIKGKLKSWQKLGDVELKKKIMGLLSRRGFGYEISRITYERARSYKESED